MKRYRSGLALVAALAALICFTGCEQVSVDTRVCPSGKIIREVVVTAPKEEAETVRRMVEPLLREKGFRHVRTQNEAVVRWVCKVNVRRNHALFQADFTRVTPFLCPVGKYHFDETISLAKYLKSDQAKLVAKSTQITYRFSLPGHLIAESCAAKNAETGKPLQPRLHQSDRLFNTYSDAAWTTTMDQPIHVSVDSKGRRNFVILFWLVVLGGLGYLFRGAPRRFRVWRLARAEKAELARAEKARKRAEKELRKAEKAREKEERRQRKQRRREEPEPEEPTTTDEDEEITIPEWLKKRQTEGGTEPEAQPEAEAGPQPEPSTEPLGSPAEAEQEAPDESAPGAEEEPVPEPEPAPEPSAEPGDEEPAPAGEAQEGLHEEPVAGPAEEGSPAVAEPAADDADESESAEEQPEGLGYTVTAPEKSAEEEAAPRKRRGLFGLFRRKK